MTSFDQRSSKINSQYNAGNDINHIVNLIVLSPDNIQAIAKLQELGFFDRDANNAEQQIGKLCEEIQQHKKLISYELDQSLFSVNEQLIKDYERFSHSLKRLQQVDNLLHSFAISPQPMMLSETVKFIFGGEAGKQQPSMHIAKALKDKKVKIVFEGLGSYDKIGLKVERDPSFPSGPLQVVIPAGTCISVDERGRRKFRSFNLSQSEPNESSRHIIVD